MAHGEIVFRETFESGTNPFSFDGYNDYESDSSQAMTGTLVNLRGNRQNVWKTTFHNHRNDSYFGHRERQDSDWNITNRFHWAVYIKFGDTDNSAEWLTAEADGRLRSYELKFPDIGGGQALNLGRIIGKMRMSGPVSDGGRYGLFRLYTPNGQNHDHTANGTPRFVSNTWYHIEFMCEDHGNNDTVKIWINKDNEFDPDYEYTSSTNMFNSNQWGTGLRWDHGYRNHNVPRDTVIYYDDIRIGNSFIGMSDGDRFPPESPLLEE
jgi:hypothetical protein